MEFQAVAAIPFSVTAFAEQWTALYRLLDDTFDFFNTCYGSARIHYPPHSSPAVSPALATLDLHPRIRELVPLLPYPADQAAGDAISILPYTRPLCYLDVPEDPLTWSRNPTAYYFAEEFPGADLSCDEIALTTAGEYGMILVLNVEKGTIREVMAEDLRLDTVAPYPATSRVKGAMEAVQEYLENFKALEWVPVEWDMTEDGILDRTQSMIRDRLRTALTQTYGWPDNFQREAWKENRERLWTQALHEEVEAQD